MKKFTLVNIISSTILCSSLFMTVPVSKVKAVSPNNDNVKVKKPDEQQNIPNKTSTFVITKDNTKKNFDQTLNYIKEQGIEVKSSIPEIGWIETARTTPTQTEKIEKNTKSDVQTPSKSANDSYKPTAISPIDGDNPVNKYFWKTQWNMQMISKDPNNFIKDRNSHVSIGIIDSGISDDYRNSLGAKIRHAQNFVPRGGYNNQEVDETGNPNDTSDRRGHGTAVTSLIMGTGEMAGVNPNVTLDEYRVFSREGGESTWVLKALIQAINNGDDIINMSLGRYGLLTGGYGGFDGNNDSAEYQAWIRAVDYATKKGSVVVVAAGNEGLNLDDSQAITNYINRKTPGINARGQGVSLPGNVPGIVQVASIGSSGQRSDFSCYSINSVYAPGGDTRKTGMQNPIRKYLPSEWILTYGGQGNYSYSCGTSFSAPEVSGMIAHEIAAHNLYKQPDKIKAKLQQSLQTNKYGLPCVILDPLVDTLTGTTSSANSSSINNSSSSKSSAVSSSQRTISAISSSLEDSWWQFNNEQIKK